MYVVIEFYRVEVVVEGVEELGERCDGMGPDADDVVETSAPKVITSRPLPNTLLVAIDVLGISIPGPPSAASSLLFFQQSSPAAVASTSLLQQQHPPPAAAPSFSSSTLLQQQQQPWLTYEAE
ncbi:hypothetical protein NQZ68_022202 [Dissostichus eleginoides]|nr:hypothetical protein NQZ68_022202 [Dissostichus eleginoides]